MQNKGEATQTPEEKGQRQVEWLVTMEWAVFCIHTLDRAPLGAKGTHSTEELVWNSSPNRRLCLFAQRYCPRLRNLGYTLAFCYPGKSSSYQK